MSLNWPDPQVRRPDVSTPLARGEIPGRFLRLLLACLLASGACRCTSSRDGQTPGEAPAAQEQAAGAAQPSDPYSAERTRMVAEQLRARDIADPQVLAVMGRVPRHEFVPAELRQYAYSDGPLPIGYDQTISQPYIVALMTQLARPRTGARSLDIGTGSGYQAAVLAELTGQVYSIEILCPLADEARERLTRLGYRNIEVRCGDGYRGWPEHAPFDLIILAAAPDHVPQPLIDQLAPGGRLVLPVGNTFQELVVVEKDGDGSARQQEIIPVRFVPMTGEAERR
jgi:protein-L-isoaspartate(D-aspartate) O-methyltransferase